MRFLVTGLNHKTAPVEVRERLAFDQNALGAALRDLRRRPGVLEAMILSTCNRVEVAAAVEEGGEAAEALENYLAEARSVDLDSLEPLLYRYEGREAIRHIFRVAASLDSMVVGEPQILGQLKAAYAAAKAEGAVCGVLDTVLTRAFSVAKRVRSETEIGQSAVSVSYAAVELAREIFGSLAGRRVLIVGAGKMSELAARHLRRAGAADIMVANRTRERAETMARLFEARIVDYESFQAALPEVDIVITSSGAPHYILRKDEMRRVIEARRNRPMFLIDIAVPRNVEPAVNELDNIYLYDIDDLARVVESNLRARREVAHEAEAIVAEEVERLVERLKAREVAPVIASLQGQLEQVRRGELERLRGRFGELTPQQEEALETLTRGIVNKIAHGPIAELRKTAGYPHGIHLADMIRRVFRLQ
ncbi:MAG: glutamyl-tRNA reductase [Acidobacteria bacterium]|nr:glutamyl-tRNA reductase [Acidobacteriota bacterium]